MKTSPFFKQADLVVQLIPFVNAETCFALKGGTAINFFVRNFPRLSVDIDLVYVSVEDRETTLRGINAALQRMADRIRRSMPTAQVTERNLPGQNLVVKDQHQPSPPGKQIVPCHLQMNGEVGLPHGHPGDFVQQQHRPSSCRQEAGQELKGLRPALQRNLGSFGLISQPLREDIQLLLPPNVGPRRQTFKGQKVVRVSGACPDKCALPNTPASLADHQGCGFLTEELLKFRPLSFSSNK